MGKRWRIQPHDAACVAELERRVGVPAVVAQLLASRGIRHADAARQFLKAPASDLYDPDLLPGIPEATKRILGAIRRGRRITVYGDYDADGMSATAILVRCLRLLGADVDVYVPNRLDDGYGLNDDALELIARRGTSLVVTVDCGIASVEEAKTARRLGLELIVTDHHEPQADLPDADVLVHPRLPGSRYPFGALCGAGVAFKLAWSLCRAYCGQERVSGAMRGFLIQSLGLAAIGTIADVVPLLDENRLLVRHGLTALTDRPPPGLAALMQVTRLANQRQLTSEDIAFVIGPRLNAAGRLGEAMLGVELLATDNEERARTLAQHLHEQNEKRDSVERGIYQMAIARLKELGDPHEAPALVVDGQGWHPGVIGLVAGRLAEKYHRPTVVISVDPTGLRPAVGSARSACGLELHRALAHCERWLLAHGGHAAAAGLKIDPRYISDFRKAFCEVAAAWIAPEDRVAELWIDAEAPFSQLSEQTVQQIEQLAPFGEGNPRPVLCTVAVEVNGPLKMLGTSGRHFAVELRQHQQTIRAVAFGKPQWIEMLGRLQTSIDVAYSPVLNRFGGRCSVEMQLVDWRPSSV
ncbi:MAG: single-stranded-DNA-specific exonuclease RecJ [Pirellulaceae bacterium]|nr:MAG: single-stranded-DNA-specific exonuclease RecJ [Pirellulaceae bacterium]